MKELSNKRGIQRMHLSRKNVLGVFLTILLGILLSQAWAFEEEWFRLFSSPSSDEAEDVAVSNAGVYVVGSTEGVFAGQTSAGGTDAFLIKYDREGSVLWTRQFGIPYGFSVGGDPENCVLGPEDPGNIFDAAKAIVADEQNVYVAGITTENDACIQNLVNAGFLRKYDVDGNEEWTRFLGGFEDEQSTTGMAMDETGLYIVGSEHESGLESPLVQKRDFDGNRLWIHSSGFFLTGDCDHTGCAEPSPLDGGVPTGVAVNETGVYEVGFTEETLPGQTREDSGTTDAYVRKYDPEGHLLWTRQFGIPYGFSAGGDPEGCAGGRGPISDRATAVAVDGSGVYVSGNTTEPAICILNLQGEGFVRKYDFEGNALWTTSIPITLLDTVKVRTISVNAAGVFVTSEEDEDFILQDIVLRQLDFEGNRVTAGEVLYSRNVDQEGPMLPRASVAEEASIYLAGTSGGPTERDAFLAKISLSTSIQVKFQEGTDVRQPEALLPSDFLDWVADITPLFNLSEEELNRIRREGENSSGETLPDLPLWFQITLKSGTDVTDFIERLECADSVEVVKRTPLSPPIAGERNEQTQKEETKLAGCRN